MTSDPVERYLTRSRRLQQRSVLRPMAGGELLDETLALYRQTAAGLLPSLAIPVLVMTVAEAFVTEYIFVRFFETQNSHSLTTQLGEFLVNAGLGLFVAAPIWIISLTSATALTVRRVGWHLLGMPSSPSEASRDARAVFPSLLRATATVTLISVLGFIASGVLMLLGALLGQTTSDSSAIAGVVALLGILGIFAGVVWFLVVAGRFGLIAPAAVLEGLRGRALIRRAVDLTKGQGRRAGAAGTVVSLAVTASLLDLLIAGSLSSISEMLNLPDQLQHLVGGLPGEVVRGAFEALPGFLGLLLVLPFFTIAITVLYFERRVRVEGYDISTLAHDIAPDRRGDRSGGELG